MAITRKLWLSSFREDSFPPWHCPRCYKGILKPVDKSFQYGQTGDIQEELINSGGSLRHSAYEFHYSVLLRCDNLNCGEYVASGGNGYVKEYLVLEDGEVIFDDAGNLEIDFTELFYPEFFYPPIPIFPIPSQSPKTVEKEIRASFNLFFTDPSAAANCIRKAVESILDEKGIPRCDSGGKFLSPENRIRSFEGTNAEMAEYLRAIKWLGNEGSHSDGMTKNDILDAYEIIEIVLEDLYVHYRESVKRKVIKINEIKKPLHPST
jgi:hypothetical protein